MPKIIRFPTERIKIKSFIEQFKNKLDNLPPKLADCLEKSFTEIYNLPLVKGKNFEIYLPNDLTENQILAIQSEIRKIINEYEGNILTVLERLAKIEAELCMLKYKYENK